MGRLHGRLWSRRRQGELLAMAEGKLESDDFETYVSFTEKAARAEVIAADDAFVKAMNKAIKRGREKVSPGTFVDTSAPIGAIRIRGEVIYSACGSPAAMCLESGDHHGGAETLK